MWKERPLCQESKLKMPRQQWNRSRMILERLNRRDWQPLTLKHYFRRCWMPSEIVWEIIQVPTMGRMGRTRMMMEKILRGASLAKMTNPAGWTAQCLNMILHRMECFRQKQMKLDQSMHPHWGDAANYFSERDMEYGTMELKVPAVVQPQTPDDAASSLPTTFCEPMETLDSVPWNLQIPQVTSRPGSSRMRLGLQEPHTQRQSVLPSGLHARLVTDSEIKAHWTHKLSPLHIASQANCQIEIGFRGRHSDLSTVARAINRQIGIYDNVSILNAIPAPILLCVSFYVISVTKLWDMIIRLCMCKGRIGHATFLNFNSHCLTTDVRDIILPVTVTWDNSNWIADKTH